METIRFVWRPGDGDLSDAYRVRLRVFCDEQGYRPDMELPSILSPTTGMSRLPPDGFTKRRRRFTAWGGSPPCPLTAAGD